MRKIQEILRLHFEQKLGQRQIARSANVSQSTVHQYLARMKAAGEGWYISTYRPITISNGPAEENASTELTQKAGC